MKPLIGLFAAAAVVLALGCGSDGGGDSGSDSSTPAATTGAADVRDESGTTGTTGGPTGPESAYDKRGDAPDDVISDRPGGPNEPVNP